MDIGTAEYKLITGIYIFHRPSIAIESARKRDLFQNNTHVHVIYLFVL